MDGSSNAMTPDPQDIQPPTLARVARTRIHDLKRPGVERFHDPRHLDEIAGRLAGLPADPPKPVIVLVDGEPDEPAG